MVEAAGVEPVGRDRGPKRLLNESLINDTAVQRQTRPSEAKEVFIRRQRPVRPRRWHPPIQILHDARVQVRKARPSDALAVQALYRILVTDDQNINVKPERIQEVQDGPSNS
jgi:hypothetical protein